MSLQQRFAELSRTDARAALVTLVGPDDHPAFGSKMLVLPDDRMEGGFGVAELDQIALESASELLWTERSELREYKGVSYFIDVIAPPPRLVIFGAVDYAAALCRLARACSWRPYVCDPRSAFATNSRFPDAEEVIVAWPDEAFKRLGIDRATFVVVLTHDPKLDDAALSIALRSVAPYVGAMGSRRAQAKREKRLIELNLSDAERERLVAPIGLDLGGTTPEETALAIMAEVVGVRNGHSAQPLSETTGRIHSGGAD